MSAIVVPVLSIYSSIDGVMNMAFHCPLTAVCIPYPLRGVGMYVNTRVYLDGRIMGTDTACCARCRGVYKERFDPFRTPVPFSGQITWNQAGLSPNRDCGAKGVNVKRTRTYIHEPTWDVVYVSTAPK